MRPRLSRTRHVSTRRSGTSGVLCLHSLTRRDLAELARDSRSAATSEVACAGERVVTTYNAGPFVAGAALDAFDDSGSPTFRWHRQHRAARHALPAAHSAHPGVHSLVRAPHRRVALGRGFDVKRRGASRCVLVAGEPGRQPSFRHAHRGALRRPRCSQIMASGDIAAFALGGM